jgi:phage baseplate assembly protein W
MAIYKGFSTQGQTKKFRATDAALIKQDLINHFNIRKGEKLMNPNFGTIIWGMLFEPMTNDLKNAIVTDITDIINYDPRVNVNNVTVNEMEHGLQIILDLTYINNNQSDALLMNFNKQTQKITYA